MKRLMIALAASALLSAVAMTAVEAKTQTGMASYYKSGKRTANGEKFNPNGMTAAHKSLPFGTRVRVTNINTGKSVVVRINDRGPFIRGRIIDLAYGAARVVGLHRSGVARVRVAILD